MSTQNTPSNRLVRTRYAPLAMMAVLLASCFASEAVQADPDSTSATADSLSWDQLGVKAQAQYSGEGISITPIPGGARLQADFQKLAGQVTDKGLWLVSTEASAAGESDRFRVTASSVGRTGGESRMLTKQGEVLTLDQVARYFRSGITEEYRVSMDGVRQDFVVMQRPAGDGELRVELAVEGASAERTSYGARLILNGSGRAIAYSRLHVTDATGRTLEAHLEVPATDQLVVGVDDSGAEYPVRIDPTFSDADWISTGGFPGADSDVNALVVDGSGNLYLGGSFTAIGDVLANHIAKWNGSKWSALGSGLDGDVNALAVSGNNLYAGGYFSTAGGSPANSIALWNGANWSPLGDGVDNGVYALLVSGNALYVGGYFSMAGGLPANHVAMWSGGTWSPLDTGVANNVTTEEYVSALALSDTNLYVGGSFTSAGGVAATNIACWNGASWSAVGGGLGIPNAESIVTDLMFFGGALIAAGHFDTPAKNIAKWDGIAWSALGSGLDSSGYSSVACLAASDTDLYAGGFFKQAGGNPANYIAKWNGSTWSALGNGMDFSVSALAMIGGTLYAGGGFEEAGGVTANYIAKWESSTWSSLGGGGFNGTVAAMAVSETNLYVGGYFTSGPGTADNYVAKWDGSAWLPLGSGVDDFVRALAVIDGELYAGGNFTHAGGIAVDYIAKWDGAAWSGLGSGVSGGFFAYVSALAVMDNELYAGGAFTNAGSVAANNIAKWDGSDWSPLGAGLSSDGPFAGEAGVNALAVSATNLYAGGWFSTAGAVSANNIARWNGSAWFPLGTGTASGFEEGYAPVDALAVSSDDLYAGGYFTEAGGVAANNIAKWNGSEWSALGAPDSLSEQGSPRALMMVGSELYLGGSFTNIAGTGANSIAVWDGTAWSAVGGSLIRPNGRLGSVNSLALLGNDLYVGGSFALAGGVVSPYLTFARPGGGSNYSGPFVVYGEGQAMVYLLVDSVGQYEIERSTNLVLNVWETLGTVPGGTNGVVSYTDTAPPLPNAYYRALLVAP